MEAELIVFGRSRYTIVIDIYLYIPYIYYIYYIYRSFKQSLKSHLSDEPHEHTNVSFFFATDSIEITKNNKVHYKLFDTLETRMTT